jgi:hypothetical protein
MDFKRVHTECVAGLACKRSSYGDGDCDRGPLPRQRFLDRADLGAVAIVEDAGDAVAVVGIDYGVLLGAQHGDIGEVWRRRCSGSSSDAP